MQWSEEEEERVCRVVKRHEKDEGRCKFEDRKVLGEDETGSKLGRVEVEDEEREEESWG